jgi:hypothetical protein
VIREEDKPNVDSRSFPPDESRLADSGRMTATRTQRFRNLIFVLIIVVLSLLGIELLVRLAAKLGWCQIRTFQVVNRTEEIRYIGDINPHFGVWHIPHAAVTVKTPRGEISYEANAHGMRDRPREEKSSAAERVVVLGDSFIEGNHVEESDRVTDVLEKQTGVEFLNFGTSGSFGSVQEWLLYQHLASRFDHTRVFVFLLPDNDFSDNDPPPDRYRPRLRRNGDSYEVTYPMPFSDSHTNLLKVSWGSKLRHTLYNNWYSLNLIVHREVSDVSESLQNRITTASYDEFSQEDLDRLLFSYRQILELAKPRPVTIFVIPRDRDFLTYQAGRFGGRIITALSEFAKQHERIKVVDLMPTFLAYMKENDVSSKAFFLGFDGHWSPLGHRVAADAVEASLHGSDDAPWPSPAPDAVRPASVGSSTVPGG